MWSVLIFECCHFPLPFTDSAGLGMPTVYRKQKVVPVVYSTWPFSICSGVS